MTSSGEQRENDEALPEMVTIIVLCGKFKRWNVKMEQNREDEKLSKNGLIIVSSKDNY